MGNLSWSKLAAGGLIALSGMLAVGPHVGDDERPGPGVVDDELDLVGGEVAVHSREVQPRALRRPRHLEEPRVVLGEEGDHLGHLFCRQPLDARVAQRPQIQSAIGAQLGPAFPAGPAVNGHVEHVRGIGDHRDRGGEQTAESETRDEPAESEDTEAGGDGAEGGVLAFRFDLGTGEPGGFDMKVLETQPGERVLWEVIDGPEEWVGTRIFFDIARKGNRTELRFTHVGLAPDCECYEACHEGWTFYVQRSLRNLILPLQ